MAVEEVVPVLRVSDAGAAADWYARLGFAVTFEHRFAPGLPAFVGIGRGTVHLYLSEHTGDAAPDALIHIWVDDVDAVADEFDTVVEQEPWGRIVELADPDGNRLRIGSPPGDPSSPGAALLVTGVYGSGKSAVVEDIAEQLEAAGVGYGAIDLDWLTWYDAGTGAVDDDAVLYRNLEAVVSNYRAVGVDRFALAGFYADAAEVDELRAALGMELTVVELVVPLDVVEQRLEAVGTPERLANLDEARRQFAEGLGSGFADFTVDADRHVREVSTDVLSLLGWLGQ